MSSNEQYTNAVPLRDFKASPNITRKFKLDHNQIPIKKSAERLNSIYRGIDCRFLKSDTFQYCSNYSP